MFFPYVNRHFISYLDVIILDSAIHKYGEDYQRADREQGPSCESLQLEKHLKSIARLLCLFFLQVK